ncbi:MAG: hypothetical protein AB1806_06565 [Acidobacteriota bacterium]
MTQRARFTCLGVCLAFALVVAVIRSEAAQPAGPAAASAPGQTAAAPAGPLSAPSVADADAEQVRAEFYALLQKYPPALGRVLKLDPSLMANEAYLAPYPGVAAFLTQHPGIARNPSYFLERVNIGAGYSFVMDERAQRRREMVNLMGGFVAFSVFLVVTGVVIWLIRTIIETRRWNRVSKTQSDVHTKLLERFTSNEDLLAYIQTPVGRRFLESGPAPVAGDAPPLGAPYSRILWSMQAGVVLAVAALGLLFLSWRLEEEVGAFFLVIGAVTLALGVGFLASSVAAFGVSRRLGLLPGSDSEHA